MLTEGDLTGGDWRRLSSTHGMSVVTAEQMRGEDLDQDLGWDPDAENLETIDAGPSLDELVAEMLASGDLELDALDPEVAALFAESLAEG